MADEDRGDVVENEVDDEAHAGGDENTDLGDGQAGGGKEAAEKVAAEADAKEAAEKAAKEEADKKGAGDEPRIPKSRFDEAVGKARREAEAAQKKLSELEAAERARQGQIDAAKVEKEIDELEDKLDAARADGNTALAAALRKEIRSKSQDLADARADVKAQYAVAQAVEQVRFDAVVSEMEKEHPELDPTEGNEAYDQDVVNEIQDLKEAFEAKGDSSSTALRKAVKLYYKGAPAKPDSKPAADGAKAAAEAKIKAAEEAAAKRKEDAVAKARAAEDAQAKAASKGGKDSDAHGKKGEHIPSKLSDDEFDKLDPKELKRLRGDDA